MAKTTVELLGEVIALVRSWGYAVTTEPGLQTRCGASKRPPCAADYGDIKNVPAAVRAAFSARKAALMAAPQTEGEPA